MNAYDQKVAIAEACGATWVNVPPQPENGFFSEYHPKRLLTFNPDNLRILPLADPRTHDSILVPDYLNDLNACSGLVDHMQTLGFNCVLIAEGEYRCCTFISNDRSREIKVISSSFTKSICEAFLKTLNLWKDDA